VPRCLVNFSVDLAHRKASRTNHESLFPKALEISTLSLVPPNVVCTIIRIV